MRYSISNGRVEGGAYAIKLNWPTVKSKLSEVTWRMASVNYNSCKANLGLLIYSVLHYVVQNLTAHGNVLGYKIIVTAHCYLK